MKKIRQYFSKLRRRFYLGPENLGKIVIPKIIGYQTATLTAMHWLNYFINKHLTFSGRIMLLVSSMMLTYCILDPLILPMSYMAFSIFIIYGLNILIGYLFKPRLNIQRELPPKAITGIPVTVNYTIDSQQVLPSWDVKIDTFSYPNCYFVQTPVIASTSGNNSYEVSNTMVFKRRGIYSLPNPFVESAFPFGLWKWGKWGSGNREVRVVPQPFVIDSIKIDFLSGEHNVSYFDSRNGSGMEFTSCREFRFGDNPRHIHWQSWARTMTPVVREMCDEGRPSVSLIFDTSFKVNFYTKYLESLENFEYSISFLAGISEYLRKKQLCLRNLIANNEIHYFEGSDTNAIHEQILDHCCELEEDRKVNPLEISNFMLAQLNSTKGVIVILQNWDENRQQLINTLINNSLPIKVFLLGKNAPLQQTPCQFISYSDLKNGQIKEL